MQICLSKRHRLRAFVQSLEARLVLSDPSIYWIVDEIAAAPTVIVNPDTASFSTQPLNFRGLNLMSSGTPNALSVELAMINGSRRFGATTTMPPEGNYELTASKGGFTPSPANDPFFRAFFLNGDLDRNRVVDSADFDVVQQNYGMTAMAFSDGDFNADGNVDFNDLALLSQRMNVRLSAAPVYPGEVTVDSLPIEPDGDTPLRVNFAKMTDERITGYRIYRSTDSVDFDPIGSVARVTGSNEPSIYTFTDDTPLDGTKYWYRIRPYFPLTLPDGSQGVQHLPTTNKAWRITPLPAPQDFTVSLSGTTVSLDWTDHSTSETRFEIQRARNSTFTNGVTTINTAANAELHEDTIPSAAGTWYYRIRAANAQQTSAYTLPLNVTPMAGNHAPVITGTPAGSMQVSPLDGFPSTLTLEATIRDFHPSTSTAPNDFNTGQYTVGALPGLLSADLGTDGTPQLNPNRSQGDGFIKDEDSFYHWFHDVPGENVSTTIAMPFTLDRSDSGMPIYKFDLGDKDFLPINGRLFGNENEGGKRNGNFTLETHTQFTYRRNDLNPPVFNFRGDDDTWVFINKKLVTGWTDSNNMPRRGLDLGGIHSAVEGAVTLDHEEAQRLGLVDGETYDFDFFFAERLLNIGDRSVLEAETSIPIFGAYEYQAQLTATDLDPADTLTWVVMEPQGATITPREGGSPLVSDLVYVPTSEDVGTTKRFKVAVTDGNGGMDMKEWEVEFTSSVNHPPELSPPVTPPPTVAFGNTYLWNAEPFFSDPDNDTLSFLATGSMPLPSGMVLTPGGILSWTPTADQIGYHAISFAVMDGHGGSLSYSFILAVEGSAGLVDIRLGSEVDLPEIVRDVDFDIGIGEGEEFSIPGDEQGLPLNELVLFTPTGTAASIDSGRDFAIDERGDRNVVVTCFRPMPLLMRISYGHTPTSMTVYYIRLHVSIDERQNPPAPPPTTQTVLDHDITFDYDWDLVLTSTHPTSIYINRTDHFWFDNVVEISNVYDVIKEIQSHALSWYWFGENFDDSFHVLIEDHGRDGKMGMGSGTDPDPSATKYIQGDANNFFGNQTIDYINGIAEVSPFIGSITFGGCSVAGTAAVGQAFLSNLAQGTLVTHIGYDRNITSPRMNLSKSWFPPYLYTTNDCRRWSFYSDGTIDWEYPP